MSDHAVTIVGWNDNYAATNFSTTPPGNGAWIVKNSWGTSFGQSGYFYISYYDAVAGKKENVIFTGEPTTNYTTNYQYYPFGMESGIGSGASFTAYGANVFTANSTGTLKAVSFWAPVEDTQYTAQVYVNPTDSNNPTSGTLMSTISGTASNDGFAYAGYYTESLSTTVPLTNGERFAVVIRFTTPGDYWPVPVQEKLFGYGYDDNAPNAIAGQSFASVDGTTWNDLATYFDASYSLVANIHAFESSSSTLSPTLTATASPMTVTVNQNFTVTGTLSTSTGGIVGQTITLQRSTDNVTWTNVTPPMANTTNATGGYQFSNNESAAGTYYYRATYAGNATYLNATSNTVNVTVTQSTQLIEYQVALPQSMIDDGEIQYFGAHGFTTVYLVAGDTQTYTAELNLIKSLGMKPVIDIEYVIWEGANANQPISSYASYFQSLKGAGWQYVASEGGRPGDAAYLRQFFSGYINYNIDNGGLWQGIYKDPATTRNSWESYYTQEWPYIQQGTTQAAALGIQNGIMAGVWADSGGNNQILTNSLSGGSPSYKSMPAWSYVNDVGFTSFEVWFHPGAGTQELPLYKQLGFEQIVANLQASYPQTGSWIPPARQATTLTLNATEVAPGTYTFAGSLSALVAGMPIANGNVSLQVSTNGGATWTDMAPSAGQNPTATSLTGTYSWTNITLASGTYYFRTYYPGDATDLQSFAPSVHGIQVTV